jgi:hypothetical protein
MAFWKISAHLDRAKGESVGAGGTFQVISLTDDEGNDLTDLVDQGTHFHNIDELRHAIIQRFTALLEVTED